jgi:hypothetical protein
MEALLGAGSRESWSLADDRLPEAPRAISKIPVDTRLTVSSLANLTLSDGH